MHAPLAQSKPAWHEAPLPSGAPVHTVRPVASATHDPWQQSVVPLQTLPSERQAPAPGSHRCAVSSHVPQQGPPPPDVQFSAVGRHRAAGSSEHLFPCVASHLPEQHCPSVVQSVPSWRHSAPEHVPALQPNEQQSLACWHAAPCGRHGARQAREAVPRTGSQRPLQQSERVEHGVPAPAHAPGGEQYPEAQWPEQQSRPLPQVSPSGRHVEVGAAPSQTGPAPSAPASPASAPPPAASDASAAVPPSLLPPSNPASPPPAPLPSGATPDSPAPASPCGCESSMSSAPHAASAEPAASPRQRRATAFMEKRPPR